MCAGFVLEAYDRRRDFAKALGRLPRRRAAPGEAVAAVARAGAGRGALVFPWGLCTRVFDFLPGRGDGVEHLDSKRIACRLRLTPRSS